MAPNVETAQTASAAQPVQSGSGLLEPIRTSRNFRSLWIGQSLSALGDSLLFVFLPLLVYEQTKSTLTMGVLMMILSIPQLILLPFSGILADRLPKVKILMTSDIIRMLLVIFLTTGIWLHFVGFWTLAIFQFCTGAMDSLFMPASAALQAEVYTPDIRNAANSLSQFTQQGARLLGPVLGGVIASFASGTVNLTLDAATFAISVITLSFIRLPRKHVSLEAKQPSAWGDFASAIRMIAQTPWLWISMIATILLSLCYASFDAILLPWLIKISHHYPSYVYGTVMAGNGLGMLASSLIFGMRGTWRKRGWWAYGALILTGAAFVLIDLSTSWIAIASLAFAAGFGVMFFNILWQTTMQELVPSEMFGRVSSVDSLLSLSLLPLGYVVVGWLAATAGQNLMMILCGALIIATALCVLLVPKIRRFD